MWRKSVVTVLLFAMVLAAFLSGCMASAGVDLGYLLEQDYPKMTNPQLTAYEQKLSDAIAASSGNTPSGISLGLGVGSWGEHSGFGLGVDRWFGGNGGGDASVALRDRREGVRVEMRRRGLLPATSP